MLRIANSSHNPELHVVPGRELVSQGAEAICYRSFFTLPSTPCLIKLRPPKAYRHPILNARLTKQRSLAEARLLYKCKTLGLDVPSLYFVGEVGKINVCGDWAVGGYEIFMEWIEGEKVASLMSRFARRHKPKPEHVEGGWQEHSDAELAKQAVIVEPEQAKMDDAALPHILESIGKALAQLHKNDIVHGDLTTSNLMIRPTLVQAGSVALPSLVIIDFGLGVVSVQDEDKAVDLYVLERAFQTHGGFVENLWQTCLESYGRNGGKSAQRVLKRLVEVRARGRKRSMAG